MYIVNVAQIPFSLGQIIYMTVWKTNFVCPLYSYYLQVLLSFLISSLHQAHKINA